MRIGIVEDQGILRELLAKLCRQEFGYQVVVQAESGNAALAALKVTAVDLLILDLMLPDIDGFEVAAKLTSSRVPLKILAMSSRRDRYALYRTERAGFQGFIYKGLSIIEEFQRAIVAILSGQTYFSPVFIAVRAKRRADPLAFEKLLSPMQHTILCMIGDSMSDRQIAEQLRLSFHAIEKQRFRMMKLLNLETRVDLLNYIQANGLCSFRSFPGGG